MYNSLMEHTVNGNLKGIRSVTVEQIKALYDIRMQQYEFASAELVEALCALTEAIGREISVYISRDGQIRDVSVGDAAKVTMPSMRVVRNEDRLCGVRCIHTHPGGSGMLSDVDVGTLRTMKLDAMAAIGVRDAAPVNMYAAYYTESEDGAALLYGPMRASKLPQRALIEEIFIADAALRRTASDVAERKNERAILVGLDGGAGESTLDELAQLADTAGAQVVGRFVQKKQTVDNATYIGSGKADELSLAGSALEADVFIFDDELTGVQTRNLEETLGCKVIDRTMLILDIFAARAQSREGKLQVELAQLKYSLTHLIGKGQLLSRLGGGIGTRGPGEKKLEIDRRRIRRRIYELDEELKLVDKQRTLRRVKRENNAVPSVALVGYTNAGKSTLLNAISGAGVAAENKLFATLDPVVRQTALPGGTCVLVSDTVGFINKLPHELVQSFRSTLEEVAAADLILHVIDASSPEREMQAAVVEDVLSQIGAGDIPVIEVYNKCDLAGDVLCGDVIRISALKGDGLPELLTAIETRLNAALVHIKLLIPYSKYDAMQLIRRDGRILGQSHEENGTEVEALLRADTANRLKKLLTDGAEQ